MPPCVGGTRLELQRAEAEALGAFRRIASLVIFGEKQQPSPGPPNDSSSPPSSDSSQFRDTCRECASSVVGMLKRGCSLRNLVCKVYDKTHLT